MNEYAQGIIDKEKKQRTGRLDLGRCGLNTIPDEVWTGMPWLKWLSLSNRYWDFETVDRIFSKNKGEINNITHLPPALSDLPDLEVLIIAGDGSNRFALNDLGPVQNLGQLKSLDCSGTKISDLDPIQNLSQLQTLYCSNTQISDLNPIQNLSQLQTLYCSNTQISELKPIQNLGQLKSLDCSGTKISELNPIQNLGQLQSLNCSYTHISELKPIQNLSQLQTLYCSNTQISELNPIQKLSQLKSLTCSYTQISGLKPIQKLSQLKSLNCSNTKISELKPIQNLKKLKSLNCSGTKISELNPIQKLSQLQTLDCRRTRISVLNPIVELLRKSRFYLSFDKEKMVSPPASVAAQGKTAILAYFDEQARLAKKKITFKPLYEAKILIVGEGGTGKTSLLRRLYQKDLGLPEKEETTRNIDIHRHTFAHPQDGEEVVLNVWDFAGQDIYYSIHQFFLTQRSLYILLDATRTSAHTVHDQIFRYWLEVVDLLSDHSPLLIFQNEVDRRPKGLAINEIQEEFNNVKAAFSGDLLKDPSCVAKIEKRIRQEVLLLPQFKEEYSPYLGRVRNRLEEMAPDRPFISWEEFYEIYEEEAVKDGAEISNTNAEFLSGTLHNLGVLLHFRAGLPGLNREQEEFDEMLERMVILQNKWATDAVYRVLDDKKVGQKWGRFTMQDCRRIWSEENYVGKAPELLQLMVRFELCYKLKEVSPSTWLLPGKMKEDRPKELQDWSNADGSESGISLRYEYDFMPRGLVNRLMVRNHGYVLRPDLSWKHGVFIEIDENAASGAEMLVDTIGGNTIRFRARGNEASRLLQIITLDLEMIHKKMPNLEGKVKKMVPCDCPYCVTQDVKNRKLHEFEALRGRIQSGMKEALEFLCDAALKNKQYHKVSALKLLRGIHIQDERAEAMEKMEERIGAKLDRNHGGILNLGHQLTEIKGLLGITNLRLDDLKLEKEEIEDWKEMLSKIQDSQIAREDMTDFMAAFDGDLKEIINDLPSEIHAYIKAADEEAAKDDTDFAGPLKVRLSIPFLIGNVSKEYNIPKLKRAVENVYLKLNNARLPKPNWKRLKK